MRKWAGTGSSKDIKGAIASLLCLRCAWALERGEKVNRGDEDVDEEMDALAAAIHAADASVPEEDARHQPSLLFLSLAAALREAPTWKAATGKFSS